MATKYHILAKSCRLRMEMTQSQLANKFGCTDTYICNIEKGRFPNPPKKYFQYLLNHVNYRKLELRIEDLLTDFILGM